MYPVHLIKTDAEIPIPLLRILLKPVFYIPQPDRWAVLDLATSPGSGDGFLLASVSDRWVGRSSVFAYPWHELIARRCAKVCWSVDQSCLSQMPVDINQICVDLSEGQGSTTAGRFFLAGGGPPVGQAGEAANAIQVRS